MNAALATPSKTLQEQEMSMHNPITICRGEGGRVGKGGPLWSPGGGACSLSIDEPTSSRDPWRATVKALPTSTQPPSPLQLIHIRHALRASVVISERQPL